MGPARGKSCNRASVSGERGLRARGGRQEEKEPLRQFPHKFAVSHNWLGEHMRESLDVFPLRVVDDGHSGRQSAGREGSPNSSAASSCHTSAVRGSRDSASQSRNSLAFRGVLPSWAAPKLATWFWKRGSFRPISGLRQVWVAIITRLNTRHPIPREGLPALTPNTLGHPPGYLGGD